MTTVDTGLDEPGAVVHQPFVSHAYDGHGLRWPGLQPGRVVVSIVVHAPLYEDPLPVGATRPLSMVGGVGRDSSEPRHGQVARLSQWDFGLTTGAFRLLDIAERQGVPAAVALDKLGCERMPGLARETAARAAEIVCRGWSANRVLHDQMSVEEETRYVGRTVESVSRHSGREVRGWFSPERATSLNTPKVLRDQGLGWFGDWSSDDVPFGLTDGAQGLISVPFMLDAEDAFALYRRGMDPLDYEDLLTETLEQLVDECDSNPKFLGLNLFGWVSGQACFANVVERFFRTLASHPKVDVIAPGDVARTVRP